MPIPGLSLEGKVAIVTGARRGNGKVIALTLAEAGADVAVCDLVVEDGELGAVAKKIRGFGRRSLTVQADISRKSDVDNLVSRAVAEFGVIEVPDLSPGESISHAAVGEGSINPIHGVRKDGSRVDRFAAVADLGGKGYWPQLHAGRGQDRRPGCCR